MEEQNIINVSGGKDSTALLLLAIERQTENLSAVFADTGNEHEMTYEYVAYLNETVFPIKIIKADFSERIAAKRQFVLTKWAAKGVPQEAIDRASEALSPTGNPFVDLCIWKGRFPSTKVAFCTEELKRNPITKQVQEPILAAGSDILSWQGVRRDESLNRKFLLEKELKLTYKETQAELWNYRPILDWTAEDAFAMHRKHNVRHNPLYQLGMGRVGCMPCINSRKEEVFQISKRFPEVIDRIRLWEDAVGLASKSGVATFFSTGGKGMPTTPSEAKEFSGIDAKVAWSKTLWGGKVIDIEKVENEIPMCTSIYGLCE